MLFKDKEHSKFYKECMKKSQYDDSYHQALFYILGVDCDTREHINDLFDFNEDIIKRSGLNKPWQTSGSYKVCLFGFNMWNGFSKGKETTPYELFNCEYAKYFQEAIKIKYPMYFRQKNREQSL